MGAADEVRNQRSGSHCGFKAVRYYFSLETGPKSGIMVRVDESRGEFSSSSRLTAGTFCHVHSRTVQCLAVLNPIQVSFNLNPLSSRG